MDLPKILLTGLFFLFFFVSFGFPRVFGQLGLGQRKPQEGPNKPKKTKKQSCMDLPKILLTGLFFFVFLEFLDIGKLGMEKRGKKQNMQKPNAPSVCF